MLRMEDKRKQKRKWGRTKKEKCEDVRGQGRRGREHYLYAYRHLSQNYDYIAREIRNGTAPKGGRNLKGEGWSENEALGAGGVFP